uniref:Uncharacterized protein n=1 Tax=Candidatus Kentrum sp. LPFa TaxID=2126335 RepID=A0A450W1F0_9GAMM|nr:MAG: hypothetical protein BECKLPF1236A_GA0070988_100453 [Candidatus Kentron sp. LPFa]VFK27305.1 MAG: hypothetical protein BECKLPF1236C_GA0070990_100453 [Candidatus Kentron sp. LPFa]
MKERVLFIGDLQRGNQSENTYKIFLLFSPIFREIGVRCEAHYSHVNSLSDPVEWLGIWQSSLRQRSDKHLDELELTTNTAIVGFELPNEDLAYLNKKNISWVNLAIHPLRFLNDLHFDVSASFDFDPKNIQSSTEEIEFCANMLRIKYSSSTTNRRKHHNTLAIFGQEPFDRSIYFDGEFMLLDKYINKLDELAKEHDKVIYKPHPFNTNKTVDRFIYDRYSAEYPIDNNPYRLILSGEISTSCAISSSIISEASVLGLHSIYLEPRAKRFSSPINYRRLLDNQEFWVTGLLSQSKPIDWTALSANVPEQLLRESFSYWGFRTPQIELSEHVFAVTTSIHQIEARLGEAEAHAAEALARITELLNSPSWRFTAPLRWVESAVHRLTLSLLNHRAKVLLWLMVLLRWSKSAAREFTPSALAHCAKMLLRRIALYVSSRPRLKKAELGVLNRFPTLKYRLERIAHGTSVNPAVQHNNVPANLADLSPQARRIYRDLKAAIGQHRKVGE